MQSRTKYPTPNPAMTNGAETKSHSSIDLSQSVRHRGAMGTDLDYLQPMDVAQGPPET
jgi:hypothetical protein